MARRRYIVAYDICEPRRLRRVCKIMEGYGDRLQYSVFVCDLSASELTNLRWEMGKVVDFHEDSVMIIDLGIPGTGSQFEFLGKHRSLPRGGPTIV